MVNPQRDCIPALPDPRHGTGYHRQSPHQPGPPFSQFFDAPEPLRSGILCINTETFRTLRNFASLIKQNAFIDEVFCVAMFLSETVND